MKITAFYFSMQNSFCCNLQAVCICPNMHISTRKICFFLGHDRCSSKVMINERKFLDFSSQSTLDNCPRHPPCTQRKSTQRKCCVGWEGRGGGLRCWRRLRTCQGITTYTGTNIYSGLIRSEIPSAEHSSIRDLFQ